MKKKFPALIVLFLLVLPSSAQALETNELIALTAMPLAVAAVAEITDVPMSDLVSVVSTLNHAAVPPTQFVEIVRYSPVALVQTTEPRFVTYVTTEYERGVVGNDLAYAIADRYPTYGVREINVVDPPVVTTYYEREILPPVVVTRFQPVSVDPLALIAMPLAVAAVSEMTDVPRNDLFSLIAALNGAMVPAPQFVEVVRYSPVMLVDRTEAPLFLSFVTTEIDRGVVGSPLAFAIADRFHTFGVEEINVLRPPTTIIVDRDEFIPPVVVTRVANVRAHPHGGPPGQLKKDLGLQTGAEVVHGTRPSRTAKGRTVRVDDNRPSRTPKVRKSNRGSGGGSVTRAPKARPSNRGSGKLTVHPKKVAAPSVDVRQQGGGGNKAAKANKGNSGGAPKAANPGKGKGKGKG
jgi:hypothetical protein